MKQTTLTMKQTTLRMILLPVAAAALLLGGKPASAQVTLDLQAPYQFGQVGDTFQFFGTLTNFGPKTVFLTGDYSTGLPSGVTVDDSPFQYNAPSQLSAAGTAGSTYTGELFDVTVAPGTTAGFYSGYITFTGGTDSLKDYKSVLNTNQFSVAAVPEASTTVSLGLLMVLGLGGLVFAARKNKSASGV